MIRIGIVGGPGSGKSSLARQLVTELYNKKQLNAQLVTEFARDYINACRTEQDGKFHPDLADQLLIYHAQVYREISLPQEVEFVVTDSPIFLPVVFAMNMADMSKYQDRTVFVHLYSDFLAKYLKWYDVIISLRREKPFFKDGTRGESAEQAEVIGNQFEAFLLLHGLPYYRVRGSDEQRVAAVMDILDTCKLLP